MFCKKHFCKRNIEENKEKNKDKKEDKKGKEQRIPQLFCNEGIQICLGVFDDPENQEQPKFYFNLIECGHVGIGVRSVSGKSTFLQTFIFSLLNKKQITEKSFTKDLNYLHLTKEASRTIVAELDKKLQTTIKHKELNKNVSYEYLMKLECYKLIKHLLGEKEYEPFKIWW